MIRFVFAIGMTIVSTSCEATSRRAPVEPAQCFILRDGSRPAIQSALHELAARQNLSVEEESPSHILLRGADHAPRVYVLYAPPEFGDILVSYRGKSKTHIDLWAEKSIRSLISSSCPPEGKDFVAPRVYE